MRSYVIHVSRLASNKERDVPSRHSMKTLVHRFTAAGEGKKLAVGFAEIVIV
jgi:hypothetical protein